MTRKSLLLVVFFLISMVPVLGFADSDRVVLDNRAVYPSVDMTITEADELAAGGPIFVGGSPIFGGDGWGTLNIYLTEAGTNVISDHLFSQTGDPHFCDLGTGDGADCIFFASDPSSDSAIGTLCTFGPSFCREEDGTLQDVTDMVTAQNGRGIFLGGRILIQSDVEAAVPEPGALSLLLVSLAGAIPVIRYRTKR